jgi:hypothetical protein
MRLTDVDFDLDVVVVLDRTTEMVPCRSAASPQGRSTGTCAPASGKGRRAGDVVARAKGPLTDWGVGQLVQRRGDQAGLPALHPHQTSSVTPLPTPGGVQGGEGTDLMRLAGWKSPAMLARNGVPAAAERARSAPPPTVAGRAAVAVGWRDRSIMDFNLRCIGIGRPGMERTTCCVVGGGPAGMVLGVLLARAGVDVTVLEKHGDFLRDFRGDTVHPTTIELLDDMGLGEKFAMLPQNRLEEVLVPVGDGFQRIASLRALPGKYKYIAMVPQWDLLNLLADAGTTCWSVAAASQPAAARGGWRRRRCGRSPFSPGVSSWNPAPRPVVRF